MSADYILRVIRIEEERFQATFDQGLGILQELVNDLKASKQRRLSGEDAFRLYDTFGFHWSYKGDLVGTRYG